MALTGNAVKDTYLDLVQLEQSGAGLPSHAGKEAALYDGSGAQILGRTAQRHWLDADPDAISGTWEFSTYGDATQGELETAGWSFTNYTASVTNGCLVLYKTAAYDTLAKAEITVDLSGDFDFVISGGPASMVSVGSKSGYSTLFGIYLADSSGSAHGICAGANNGLAYSFRGFKGSTYADLGSGTSWAATGEYLQYLRVFRESGTVWLCVGNSMASTNRDPSGTPDEKTWRYTSVADASTFDKLILVGNEVGKTNQYTESSYFFIRRYL